MIRKMTLRLLNNSMQETERDESRSEIQFDSSEAETDDKVAGFFT